MADVFAELVAKLSIDDKSFNSQLNNVKKNLENVGKKQPMVKVQKNTDKATSSVRKLNTEVAKLKKNGPAAGKATAVSIGGITGQALKAVAVMGTIELALGGINVAAKAFSGNITDAADAIKQLPAGIGPVATQLEGVLDVITNIKSETELIETLSKKMEQAMKARMETFWFIQKLIRGDTEDQLSLEREIAIEKARGDQDEIKRINRIFDAKKRIRDLEADIANQEEQRSKLMAQQGGSFAEADKLRQELDSLNAKLLKRQADLNISITPAAQIVVRTKIALLNREIEKTEKLLRAEEEIIQAQRGKLPALNASIEKKDTEIRQSIEELNAQKELTAELEKQSKTREDIDNKIKALKGFLFIIQKTNEELYGPKVSDAPAILTPEQEKQLNAPADRARKEKERKEIATAKRIQKLKNDIAIGALKAQGKEQEAQILALKQKFAEDIIAAGGPFAGLQEQMLLLKKLGQDIAAVKDKEPKNEREDIKSRFEKTLAFLVGVEKEAKIDRDRKRQERREEKKVLNLDRIMNANEDIRDILKKNPGLVFG